MNVNLPESWRSKLQEETEKDYFKELWQFVETEYQENTCFPEAKNIFAAFDFCPLEKTKVVILGQDPYAGKGQAHGLCFSVQKEAKIPPSLLNIFKEIQTDLKNPIPETGNLERWAKQGVLLLNATMTVREKEAGSHQKKGWELFTNAVIETVSKERNNVVFMLWGNPAKKKAALINEEKHLVLTSGHPSPLSAIRGHWFGNRHFSKTNEFLQSKGETGINW
ncbi:MAG TPA: uracil-DNA glycosylase [Flavobacteriaceae bacterium]|nr:uracil-DNA glycosylase [Flavobacteriaceae bacterium]